MKQIEEVIYICKHRHKQQFRQDGETGTVQIHSKDMWEAPPHRSRNKDNNSSDGMGGQEQFRYVTRTYMWDAHTHRGRKEDNRRQEAETLIKFRCVILERCEKKVSCPEDQTPDTTKDVPSP